MSEEQKDFYCKKDLLKVIKSWTRIIDNGRYRQPTAVLADLSKSMEYILKKEGYQEKIVKQFSIDVEMDEHDLLTEMDISNALAEVWEINGKKDREVVGASYKATWDSEDYHNGEGPVDSD